MTLAPLVHRLFEAASVSRITYHAGQFTRVAFFNYVKARQFGGLDKFGAELILADSTKLYMAVSEFLAVADPFLGKEAIDGVIPVSKIEDGEGMRVPLAHEAESNTQFSRCDTGIATLSAAPATA
jgi:hypothetical protein